MKQHSVLLAVAATAIIAALAGCSTHSPYYDKDGPPSVGAHIESSSATPKIEAFRQAANRPYTVLGTRYSPITTDQPLRQRGTASWYGKQFHGNKTSIGEVYDMYQPTAAHPTMPLPSYARVTNLKNNKSIIVRVNDRGPFLHGRIIDLSYAAAKTLGYANAGPAQVEVERLTWDDIRSGRWKANTSNTNMLASATAPLTSPAPAPSLSAGISKPQSGWGVQVGSFSSEDNARSWAAHCQAVLAAVGDQRTARIVQDGMLWRVIMDQGLTYESAASAARIIGSQLGVQAFSIQK